MTVPVTGDNGGLTGVMTLVLLLMGSTFTLVPEGRLPAFSGVIMPAGACSGAGVGAGSVGGGSAACAELIGLT